MYLYFVNWSKLNYGWSDWGIRLIRNGCMLFVYFFLIRFKYGIEVYVL